MTTLVARHACAVILAALSGAILGSCTPPPPPDERQILKDIEDFRAAKDQAFGGTDSPVPRERRPQLLPLGYYPVSLEYRVPAVLSLSQDRSSIEMPTSTGQIRKMVRVGRLEFTLKGQRMGLSAFVEAGARDLNRLFVPFSDLTSGAETYPAGRYLDLDRTATGLYVIDFNRAYHPFCYYDPSYDCPYPPRENRLAVPIRAGERVKS